MGDSTLSDRTRAEHASTWGRRVFPTLAACAAMLLTACAHTHSSDRSTNPHAGGAATITSSAPFLNHEHAFIESLLARMTLEEKVGQTVQLPANLKDGKPPEEIYALTRAGRIGAMIGLDGAERTRELQRVAVEESRLGIPLLFGLDVIHGYRTVFPVPLAAACSFDPEAVEASERTAAREATSAGLQWTFAPMVDIGRDPRWGRIVEGAGEDTYLGSVMGAARVRGFQGTDLRNPDSMLACAKHYVAYGAAEGGRDYNTVIISDRVLHETYLPPFRSAVSAGVGSLMTAFNDLSGVPATAHGPLINGTLKHDWNWDGFVVSDWESIKELIAHGVAGNTFDAARLGINAGVDMDMASRCYLEHLPTLVREGRVDEAAVTEAARRVLRAKYRLGLFSDPYARCDVERERRTLLAPEHRAQARDLARKSIVLLKNDRATLPMTRPGQQTTGMGGSGAGTSDEVGPIAIIGALAVDGPSMLGPWSLSGKPEEAVTILDGLRATCGGADRVRYAGGYDCVDPEKRDVDEAVRVAEQGAAIVLVLGEPASMSAEAKSRAWIDLPANQRAVYDAVQDVADRTGKPLVVVMVCGRPMAIPQVKERAPAIVQAWFLGTETGNAIADVLFGDFNPGGKLAVTIPAGTGQIPMYYNHRNTGRPGDANNVFTSKYIDFSWAPLYPFGHGLSYTTFAYSGLRCTQSTADGGSIAVSVQVKNTGAVTGDEVVQVYCRQPVASVSQPVKSLRAFKRLTLAPGEERTLRFTIPIDMLAIYDAEMRLVVERGTFEVMVGSSSDDIRARTTIELREGRAPHTPREPGTVFSTTVVE